MAFWATNLGRVSQIDTILDKEDVTLAEILEQPEVIQECKGSNNKKLIEFLTRTDILNQLLDLILQEPDPSLDEKTRYKLPNIASEIITCDVKQINEKLSSDPSMLDKLYNFLDSGDAALNPLLTSFFSKVFGVFITRRTEQDYFAYQYTCYQVVNYIKSKPNFLGLLLKHIHTSAILDLLLRLIKCVEGDAKVNVLDWLNEGNLIPRCIQMFAPQEHASTSKQHQEHASSSIELQEHDSTTPKQHEEQASHSPPTEQQQPASPKEQASDDNMSTEQSNLEDGVENQGETKDGIEVEDKGEGEKEVIGEVKGEDVEMKEEENSPAKEEASGMEETPVLTPAEETPALTPGEDAPTKEEAPGSTTQVSSGLTDDDYWSEENLRIRDMHDNVGQLLVEIIRGSRDFMLSAAANERCHNSLLVTAESRQICESLIDVMLMRPARESVIVNIVSVLLCLLEVRKPMNMDHGFSMMANDQVNSQTSADIQHQEEIVLQTLQILVPRLPNLVNLLANPPVKAPVMTTAGLINPPFGASRLWTCKLLATLLATKNSEVNSTLASTQFLNTQLELFFHYTLNNFLHSQTESIIRSILEWEPMLDLNKTAEVSSQNLPGDTLQTPKVELENPLSCEEKDPYSSEFNDDLNENPLLVQLFSEARLLERLVCAWEGAENDPKIAYMGHVTQISNRVVEVQLEKESETPPTRYNRIIFNQIFDKMPEELKTRWEDIVSDKLSKINSKNEIKSYRDKHSSDDDSDFRDIQFPQDSTLQQLMNDNMEDTFGFTSEDFNTVEEGYGKMTASDSCLVVTDETKKAIFEKICSSQGSCDSDDEEDIWADKTAQITFGEPVDTSSKKKEEVEEHSSEEEDATGDDKMDVDQDPWNLPSGEVSSTATVAMDTSAPWAGGAGAAAAASTATATATAWDTNTTAAVAEAGWANFDAGRGEAGAGEDEEAGGEGEGWASFETAETAIEDTSAGNISANDSGNNWADFSSSSLDAAGGEGFVTTKLGEGVEIKEKSEDWAPAMSSSPEATMIDQFEERLTESGLPEPEQPAAGPGTLRPASPDFSNTNANHAPVPSDYSQQQKEADGGSVTKFTNTNPDAQAASTLTEKKLEGETEKGVATDKSPKEETADLTVEADSTTADTETQQTMADSEQQKVSLDKEPAESSEA